MHTFSKTSWERLSTCDHDLFIIMSEVLKVMDISILVGHRTEADQNKAFQEGLSKLQWPKSKHNTKPSLAVDIAPYPISWSDKKRFYYVAGIVKGIASKLYESGEISHKVRWGGDWDSDNDFNDQRFNDLVHFELVE